MADEKPTGDAPMPQSIEDVKWAKIRKKRGRVFMCVVYEDSAPDNWREILRALHVGYLISPYHDKDVNPDGTPKKPHWHVVLIFDCVKSGGQVAELMWTFGGVVSPKPEDFFVNSLRGIARYLCHMDNPEKWQYDPADVEVGGDLDYNELVKAKNADKRTMREIMDFVLDNDQIQNWYQFLEWARRYQTECYELACDQTLRQIQNALFWKWKSRAADMRKEYWISMGLDPEWAEAMGLKPGALPEGFVAHAMEVEENE